MNVLKLATYCMFSVGVMTATAMADGVLPPEVRAKASGEVVWWDASGGLLTRARDETTNKRFTEETGVTLKSDFSSDMTKFFAAMESGAPIPWSLVEFGTEGDFLRARDAGYLEKLDTSIVPVDKLNEGGYSEYGISTMLYGIVLTYNTTKFSGDAAPKSMADLYDTARFPGTRCLFKYPQFGGVLESALVGDGVKPAEIYPLDLDRAFKKLDSIKSDIIWWSNGDDAVRLIASGECTMGIAWSGRVYSAITNDKAPLAVQWQDSVYSNSNYAVPKGAPNPVAGQVMIAHFISDNEGQKELVKKLTYTTPLKALSLSDYGPELAPWLVAGENAQKAFKEDSAYYAKNITEIVDRFNRWVATE